MPTHVFTLSQSSRSLENIVRERISNEEQYHGGSRSSSSSADAASIMRRRPQLIVEG